MAESKVQLKREEVVGDEVVLEDIDPKTSTGSVVDEASGLNLNEVIARLKDDINSQLSRVVNSVNGRTGVVVLTAKDVGLGNVDNKSFADIQNWTLDEIEHAFLTRGFKIFETLNEVDTILNDQDRTLNGSGFFTKTGHIDDNDKKSYIGYFALDENNILVAQAVSINNIGATDNSLLYDEKAGDKDYTGGRLGINIWKDEEYLELYNGISETDDPKENSGLRINRDKLIPNFYFFEGCYGTDYAHPGEAEDSLMYTPLQAAAIDNNAPYIFIYYDPDEYEAKYYDAENGKKNKAQPLQFPIIGDITLSGSGGSETLQHGMTLSPMMFVKPWFRPKVHDKVMFNFSSRYLEFINIDKIESDDGVYDATNTYFVGGLWKCLLSNNPAIGEVTEIIYNDDKSYKSIVVHVHSMKMKTGGGLGYESKVYNHGTTVSDMAKEGPAIILPQGPTYTPYTIDSVNANVTEPLIYNTSTGAESVTDEDDLKRTSLLTSSENVSGLTVRTNTEQFDFDNRYLSPQSQHRNEMGNDWRQTNLPTGPFNTFDKRFKRNKEHFEGVSILPDSSLCVIPAKSYLTKQFHFGSTSSRIYNGSQAVANWRADGDYYVKEALSKPAGSNPNTVSVPSVNSGFAQNGECLLGINLNKIIINEAISARAELGKIPLLANASGLKIANPGNNDDFTREFLMDDNFDWSADSDVMDDIPPEWIFQNAGITGGLTINCGKYLKIEPALYKDSDKFYDGGKLTIDMDAFDSGLTEDEDGKLSVSVGMGKGIMKYTDNNTIGINLKKSSIGFNSSGAPDVNVLKQWTGISSKFLILDSESLASFKANGSYYENIGGNLCAKALVINTGDGLKIDKANAIAVRTSTKTKQIKDGQWQKDENGKIIYNTHGHGLCIYGDESSNDTKDQLTDEYYTGGAVGVQVVDPGTNAGHGITINEHGTLCVDFSANTINNSSIAEDIKKSLKLDDWTITGNEVVTVNNIPQTDPTKVTYTYNPTNQPLNIKLGKGLIFIDERGLNDTDEDDDGCGCPNCKCNYCDYVVNMPGKETFHVLEWIRSDGLQRIDLDMQFSSDNTHIFEPIYMHTVGTDEDKRDYSNGTQIIFAAGRLNAIGTHALICDKGTTYAEIIDKNEDVVKTEKNIKRDPGKKFTGSITYKVTKIIANWKYGDGIQLEPDEIPDPFAGIDDISEEVACDSDGLAVSLVSIFGVPHKLGGNLSTNAKITMYGFKIYEKTKLKCIADLVPVKCVCDNGIGPRHGLVGLFDRISNTFYPNSAKETGISPNFIAGPETDVILNSKGEDISALSGEKAVTYIGLRHITSETMSNKIIIDDAPLNPEAKKRIIQVEFVNIHGGATIKRQDILTIGDGERGTQRFFLGGPGGISKSASVVNNDKTEAIAEQNESSAIGTDMRTFIGYVTFSTDTKLITGDLIHISDEAAQEIVRSQSSAGFNTDKLAAGPITLFSGYSNSNIITDPALIRLYSIKILEDDKITPIVDLKPVIRSDNVVGLLDIVNKKFYQDKDDTLFTASRETTGVIYNWKGEEIKDT